MIDLISFIADNDGIDYYPLVGIVNYEYHFQEHFLSGDVYRSTELNAIEEVICGLIRKHKELSFFEIGRLLGLSVISSLSPRVVEDVSEVSLIKKSLSNLINHHQICEIEELKYKLTPLGEKGTELNKKFSCIEKSSFSVFVDSFSKNESDIYKIISNVRHWKEITNIEIKKSNGKYLTLIENQRPEIITNDISHFSFAENIKFIKSENLCTIFPVGIYYNKSTDEFEYKFKLEYEGNLNDTNELVFDDIQKSKILKELKFLLVSKSVISPDIDTMYEFIEKWDWNLLSQSSDIKFDKVLLSAFIEKWDWSLISLNTSIQFSADLIERFISKWDWDRISQNQSFLFSTELVDKYSANLNWKLISGLDIDIYTKSFIDKFKDCFHWNILSKNSNFKIDNSLLYKYKDYFNWNAERSEFLPTDLQEIEIYQKYINFNNLFQQLDSNKIILLEAKGIIYANKDRIKPLSLERIQFTDEIIELFTKNNLIKWDSKRWIDIEEHTAYKWRGRDDSESIINKQDLGFFDNQFVLWDISLFNKYKSKLYEYCDTSSLSNFINRISSTISLKHDDPILELQILNWDQLIINPNITINYDFLIKYKDKIDWQMASGVAQVYEDDTILQTFNTKIDWDIIIEKREKIINSNTFKVCYQNIDQELFFDKYENQITPDFLSQTFNVINWDIISAASNEDLLQTDVISKHVELWNWDILSSNERLQIDNFKLIKFSQNWNWTNLSSNKTIDELDPWELIPYSESLDWSAFTTENRITTFLSKIGWDLLKQNEQVEYIINLALKFPNEWIWGILKFNKHLPFVDEILFLIDKTIIWNEIINDSRFHLDISNIEKYKYKLDWPSLTTSKRLNKKLNVLSHFIDKWDWDLLSENSAIYNDISIVQKFKTKFKWNKILETCDQNVTKEIIYEFRNEWIKPFSSERNNFEMAVRMFREKFSHQNYFVPNSEFLKWQQEFCNINQILENTIFESPFVQKFGTHFLPKYVKDIVKIIKDPLKEIESNNGVFIEKEMERCESLFNDIAGVSLDEQQRKCIIIDEDNSLVVAGAGSGKTMTIAGKVKYLTEKRKVKPENILLITFTRKAMEEMEDRVKIKMGIDLEVRTFNSLGLDIIGKAEGVNRPSLKEDYEIRKFLNDSFINLSSQPEYKNLLQEYFAYYLKLYKPLTEFKNQGEYILYVKENNLSFKSIEVETKGTVSLFKEQLKSQEEVEIANYLHLNNIKYEYEKEYKVNLANEDFNQYKPDFYLPEYDIYIEHFAFVDEGGNVPDWFRSDIKGKPSYYESAIWKREIHKKYNTTLIESYSYEKSRGQLKENLKIKLENHGVQFNPKSIEDVDEIIKKYYKPELRKFSDLLQTYITLLKQSRQNLEDVLNKSKELSFSEELRFTKFMEIFSPICLLYNNFLSKGNSIDFSDMINRAIDHVDQKRIDKMYDYIIIDEFQDTSINRGMLIKSLRSLNPNCKLFCVGDDWQSIYRFAGSDISLFTNFEEYFGKTKISEIETTYRFDNSIIELSSSFVLENHNQLSKNLKPIKNVESPTFEIVYYLNDTDELKKAFEKINYMADGKEKTVLILGRYKSSFDNILASDLFLSSKTPDTLIYKKYPSLKITKLTVHKSKGLGADFVIVLGCNNGKYGFPSELNDDAVLKTVLSEADQFPNGEERRLFYVAMTRTKEYLFLFADINNPSKFIKELDNAESIKNENMPACPTCGDGSLMKVRLNKATNGKFWGCSNYPMCTCSIEID